MKSGWKTSEFWLTSLASVSGFIGQYGGMIPNPWGVVISTVVTATYTIARTLVKKGE